LHISLQSSSITVFWYWFLSEFATVLPVCIQCRLFAKITYGVLGFFFFFFYIYI
jgi:hypothetical protein